MGMGLQGHKTQNSSRGVSRERGREQGGEGGTQARGRWSLAGGGGGAERSGERRGVETLQRR